ncbi:MAG TPA: aminotransferase class I/II-fold pyridoxal phosphate-dependent enzyme [Phycisphaerales bacterium]|nr:aminotransferase class I/II-fold pyridoxal phosphate-dependent enzyme [Phycisphaerales bacterium]
MTRPAPMISDRLRPLGESIFAKYTALAIKHGAVNLSQGFPDFDGPADAKAAAIGAINAGHAQYAPMTGVPPLREAIAHAWAMRGNRPINPDTDVTVTAGCSEAIVAAMLGFLNPGDEVVIFEPFFDFYAAGAAMTGATARYVPLRAPAREGEAFGFDERELRAAFGPRTRAIIVNTPHNPTGKVFTREELEVVADLCRRHDAVAITDEVYEHLTFDPALPHIHLSQLDGMAERTITLSSLGKTFSLTGWKVGWAIAPPALGACVRAAHQYLTFSGATPLQHGAVVPIRDHLCRPGGGEYVAGLRSLFIRNRDALAAALKAAGLRVHRSDSTYFLMADHTPVSSRLGLADDHAFCEHLTREIGVAAIPPSVFYSRKELGRPLVRFAFCKRADTIDEACRRLSKLGADAQ